MEKGIRFIKASERSILMLYELLGKDMIGSTATEITHYTNLDGLIGIVQSGGFWLSDIRFLNDAEEYKNGSNLSIGCINEALQDKKFAPFQKVLKDSIAKLSRPLTRTYYTCSFSKKSDSLEQWRAYSNNDDGVALVFGNEPQKKPSHFVISPLMSLYNIIYDDDIKLKIIRETLDIFLDEYIKDLENNTLGIFPWVNNLCGNLSYMFNIFKNNAYNTEQEIRIIVHSGPVEDGTLNLFYRTRRGIIVPYIKSSELYNDAFVKAYGKHQFQLPLKKVIVGPMAKQDVTIQSIKNFLDNSNYKNVLVEASKIPYRG